MVGCCKSGKFFKNRAGLTVPPRYVISFLNYTSYSQILNVSVGIPSPCVIFLYTSPPCISPLRLCTPFLYIPPECVLGLRVLPVPCVISLRYHIFVYTHTSCVSPPPHVHRVSVYNPPISSVHPSNLNRRRVESFSVCNPSLLFHLRVNPHLVCMPTLPVDLFSMRIPFPCVIPLCYFNSVYIFPSLSVTPQHVYSQHTQ